MSVSPVEWEQVDEFIAMKSWFQGVHVETGRKWIQANLIRTTPLGSGDPCPDCESLNIVCCEEPCKKIHDFMKMNPDLGDKY